jgi:hypothetical protein
MEFLQVVRQLLRGPLLNCALTALLLASGMTAARAQIANVTVRGSVTDQSGAVVPNATVTAVNTENGGQKTGTSDAAGRYSILDIAPGIYNVSATAQGFSKTEQLGREFLVGQTVDIDFSLKVSSVSQTVEVNTGATAVDTTEAQVATMITPATEDNLPTITRVFSDLAALTPGVLVATTSGTVNNGEAVSVNGAMAYETGYIVDGTIAQNDRTSGSILNFAQDWIKEFSVISEMPTAEFGQSSGGLINAVTRSGTNQIHGRAYEFLQNSALNAYPWRSPTNPQANVYRTGGMVGGPIKKDKLFYFLAAEYFKSQQAVAVNLDINGNTSFLNPALGVENGTFNITNKYFISMSKLDYTINPKNTLWLRWNYQGNSTTNAGLTPTEPIGAASYTHAPQDIYAGAWDFTISPSEFNEVRSNFNRNALHSYENCVTLLGKYPGSTSLYPDAASTLYGGGDPTGWWTSVGYPSISSAFAPRCQAYSSGGGNAHGDQGISEWHLDEVLTKVVGPHTVKFGFSPHWYALNTYADYRNRADPSVQVSGLAPFTFNAATEVAPVNANGTINLAANGPSTLPIAYAGAYQTLVKNYAPAWAFGFFAEDSWRINGNLTLSVGLRWDIDKGNEMFNKVAPPDHNQINAVYGDIAPRFGFAWTPFKNKNTVIRGGMGVFYDKNTFNLYGAYLSDAAQAIKNFNLTASKATQNPWCFGNTSCATSVPAIDQVYLDAEMANALNNYTLPVMPAPNTTQTLLFGNGSTRGCTISTPTQTCVIVPGPFYSQSGQDLPSPVGVTYDVNKNYTIPGNVQLSVGAAHGFGALNVSADFTYLHGYNLLLLVDANVNPAVQFINGEPAPGGNPDINLPINPAYTQNLNWSSLGVSTLYSMRVSSNYHDRRGDSATLAYSLGWAWDDDETQTAIGTGTPVANPFNPRDSYGPSSNDARNILNLSGTGKIPFGILISPIFQYDGALPYTATTTAASVPGCPSYYYFCYPVGYSQNSLRGDPVIMFNSRLSKVIKFGEVRSATVFAEGYNLLNRSNFGTDFNASVTSSTFGQPTNVVTNRRQFQFGGRFDF